MGFERGSYWFEPLCRWWFHLLGERKEGREKGEDTHTETETEEERRDGRGEKKDQGSAMDMSLLE